MKTPLLTLVAFCAFCFLAFLPADGDDWKNKVDAEVLQAAENGETVEWLTYMSDQADVSDAYQLGDKTAKGNYVYETLSALAQSSQVNVIRTLRQQGVDYRTYWVVNAVWVKGGDIDLIKALARLPEVATLQANPKVAIALPEAETEDTPNGRAAAIEWGILKMAADQVWAMGYTGQNIVIGGQDTGVEWDHPSLKTQYRGWDGSTADHNYNWHDAIHSAGAGNPCGSDSPAPCDDHNHGTHTIGTIVGDDGGTNQIGMAPGAKWIACRNMDRGYGTPTTYIECFQWFLAPTDINDDHPNPSKAPHVINNSWGCPPSEGCNSSNFATMEAVVNNLRSAGIIVVASAGNGGSNCSTISSPPAMFSGSFSVGATNNADNIAGFSSRGPVTVDGSNRMKPDISAPGVAVRSATRNGNYASFSGTSMAGPHIVGAIALMLSADPANIGNVSLIENTLINTAVGRTTNQNCGGTAGSAIPNNTYGHGRGDVLAAVNDLLQALPVELLDFKALPIDQHIHLQWQTAREWQHDHFIIEKSIDLGAWQAIGQEPALAAEDSHQDYQFKDHQPHLGTNYYRLKSVALDGAVENSKVISVDFGAQPNWSIYPNPVKDLLHIEWTARQVSGPVQVAIYQSTGQLVEKRMLEEGNGLFRIDTRQWPEGLYSVVLQEEKGGYLYKQRIIKL
ncbi:MAG: S8 family serine peptidase [Bacteroidota bacterium]